MNVPKPVLSAVTEFLLDPVATTRSNPERLKGFSVGTGQWACLWEDSASNATWYFRPIGQPIRSSVSIDRKSKPKLESLREDTVLTGKIRESLQLHSCFRGETGVDRCFFIASGDDVGAVLIVKCVDLKLVAETLVSWGEPPKSVILDWQLQRQAIAASSHEFAPLHTAETFVSDEGVLLPIFFDATMLSEKCQRKITEYEMPMSFFAETPDWPDLKAPLQQLHFSWLQTSSQVDVSQTMRISKVHSLSIATLLAVAILVALSVFAYRQYQADGVPTHLGVPLHHELRKQVAEVPGVEQIDETSPKADAMGMSEVQLQLEDFTEELESDASAGTRAGEMTIESLLSQLQGNGAGFDRLRSRTASTIIDETLNEVDTNHEQTWRGLTETQVEDSPDAEQDIPRNELEVRATNIGTLSLARPLEFKAAISRATLTVGKPVIAKDCRCTMEIKLPNNTIVEPLSAVTIAGNGKQSWRIAIDDEGPELVVEIASKPGFRWQIMAAVGLRQGPGDPPILLNPRDAQNVSKQLILASQWNVQAIEALQNARANSRGKSTRDLIAEIKRLSAQQKEVDKAIDRWRTIAKLSHQFFDQVEVKMEFIAAEKK